MDMRVVEIVTRHARSRGGKRSGRDPSSHLQYMSGFCFIITVLLLIFHSSGDTEPQDTGQKDLYDPQLCKEQ